MEEISNKSNDNISVHTFQENKFSPIDTKNEQSTLEKIMENNYQNLQDTNISINIGTPNENNKFNETQLDSKIIYHKLTSLSSQIEGEEEMVDTNMNSNSNTFDYSINNDSNSPRFNTDREFVEKILIKS